MISLSKGGDPAERNPNVGPIGETLSYVQRQVWVQEIAVWVQETASVAYGWVGAVMEAKPPNAQVSSFSGSGSRCWRYSVVVVEVLKKVPSCWRQHQSRTGG